MKEKKKKEEEEEKKKIPGTLSLVVEEEWN